MGRRGNGWQPMAMCAAGKEKEVNIAYREFLTGYIKLEFGNPEFEKNLGTGLLYSI